MPSCLEEQVYWCLHISLRRFHHAVVTWSIWEAALLSIPHVLSLFSWLKYLHLLFALDAYFLEPYIVLYQFKYQVKYQLEREICLTIKSKIIIYSSSITSLLASLLAQTVKCQPAMWETWVQSLGQEDTLEKEMATHSSTLAWKIPWIGEPGGLQSMGWQRVGHDWATSLTHHIPCFALFSS